MTPTFTIDDGDNLTHSTDDTEMTGQLTRCIPNHANILAAGHCTYEGRDGCKRILAPEDQKWTEAQVLAKARYGSFPAYYRFGKPARKGTAYFRVNDIAHWVFARYIVERPDLVIAAEKAGFIRDGYIPTSESTKPRNDNGKKVKPKPTPTRQWGPGKLPSRKNRKEPSR